MEQVHENLLEDSDEQNKVAKALSDVGVGGWNVHDCTQLECAAGPSRRPTAATGQREPASTIIIDDEPGR